MKRQIMDKAMPNIAFRIMSFFLRNRYHPKKVKSVLDETGIKAGDSILDFGCGPGGYAVAAASIVGVSGKVYALDIQELAGAGIRRVAEKRNLQNIEFICSGCDTGLEENSMDVVLCYDVFHMLKDKQKVMTELHRVLKPEGIMSFSDHHLKDEVIRREIDDLGLFEFIKQGEKTYSYIKKDNIQG